MELDRRQVQYEKANRKGVLQIPLPLQAGQPIRLKLQNKASLIHFANGMDGNSYTNLDETVEAVFLYPDHRARFHCFTAPRVGLFARGVRGAEQGKAVFYYFKYQS